MRRPLVLAVVVLAAAAAVLTVWFLVLRPAAMPGTQLAMWRLAGEVTPTATATEIKIEASAAGCSSTEPTFLPPQVAEDGETVTIEVRSEIPPGPDQTCQGWHPTPFTVTLAEPLGERTLVNPFCESGDLTEVEAVECRAAGLSGD